MSKICHLRKRAREFKGGRQESRGPRGKGRWRIQDHIEYNQMLGKALQEPGPLPAGQEPVTCMNLCAVNLPSQNSPCQLRVFVEIYQAMYFKV